MEDAFLVRLEEIPEIILDFTLPDNDCPTRTG
jgi:hypothetical protein